MFLHYWLWNYARGITCATASIFCLEGVLLCAKFSVPVGSASVGEWKVRCGERDSNTRDSPATFGLGCSFFWVRHTPALQENLLRQGWCLSGGQSSPLYTYTSYLWSWDLWFKIQEGFFPFLKTVQEGNPLLWGRVNIFLTANWGFADRNLGRRRVKLLLPTSCPVPYAVELHMSVTALS